MILCAYYTCCQAFWASWLCPRAWLTWIIQGSRNRDQQWPVRVEGRVHSPQELFLPIDQLVVSICWHRHHMRKKVEAMLLPCLSCLRIYILLPCLSQCLWRPLSTGKNTLPYPHDQYWPPGHPGLVGIPSFVGTHNVDWFTCTIMYLDSHIVSKKTGNVRRFTFAKKHVLRLKFDEFGSFLLVEH